MKIKRILCLFALIPCLSACNWFKKNKEEPQEEQREDSGETQKMLVLNTNSISIPEEKTFKLEATIDASLSKYLLFWSVEDESIAKVSDDGLVTGVKIGYTICVAQCGKYQARCAIEVTPYVPEDTLSVSFEKTSYILNVNDTYTLNPVVKFGRETITSYTSSAQISNTSVISYTSDVIIAKAAGESDLLLTYSYLEYSVQQLLHVVVY